MYNNNTGVTRAAEEDVPVVGYAERAGGKMVIGDRKRGPMSGVMEKKKKMDLLQ